MNEYAIKKAECDYRDGKELKITMIRCHNRSLFLSIILAGNAKLPGVSEPMVCLMIDQVTQRSPASCEANTGVVTPKPTYG